MHLETLEVEVEGSVGRLRLNRPEKLNPLGAATLRELAAAARWFDGQEGVKVVVVRGAGRAFSAGADLETFSGAPEGSPRDAADLGVDQLICYVQFGYHPHESVMRTIEILGREVLPEIERYRPPVPKAELPPRTDPLAKFVD